MAVSALVAPPEGYAAFVLFFAIPSARQQRICEVERKVVLITTLVNLEDCMVRHT